MVKELTRTWQAVRAWVRANPFWVDLSATIPALLLFIALPIIDGYHESLVLSLLLSVLFIAPLAIRRCKPVLSAVIIYSTGFMLLVLQVWDLTPAAIAVPIALYSVTLHGPRWAYRSALLGGFAGMTWLVVGNARDIGYTGDVVSVLFFSYMSVFTIWAVALVRRSRRETVAALVERAERLETERAQQHQLATAAERTRIAREMHDIVAHSLSVIIAQADGGHYIARQDSIAAERVLGTIAETGRDALADMRRLLGVLRPGPASPKTTTLRTGPQPSSADTTGAMAVVGADDRTPQPRSGDLDTLVSQVRASGLRVSFIRMGTARQLPPGMGLVVYRICQESLTNILKHAGPAPSVTVLLRWDSQQLTLDVSDDGRGAAANSDGAGQGLLGMAERATMFGGTLSNGPRAGGGFRIHLELPLRAVGLHSTIATTPAESAESDRYPQGITL